ncbi:MAG: methylmalonyl-CoA mutase [Actinomycetales bacterium]|nr:methylmalonyl-CoA mutase [Actinomycetales bacterium]
MAGQSQEVNLAEGFDPQFEAWEKATAAVLRKSRKLAEDAPDSELWEILSHVTLDEIEITPLGTPNQTSDLPSTGLPGQAPYTRGSMTGDDTLAGWDIRGWFIDPKTDAEAITAELENGANSLWLTLGESGIPVDRLATLLEPVYLDLAPVVLDAPEDPLAAAREFVRIVADKAAGVHRNSCLGVDPAGNRWRRGGAGQLALAIDAAKLAQPLGIRGVLVDATVAHEQGASEVQELAWSMMVAVTYLRALTEAGLSVDEAAAQLEFRYAATDNQFLTIAKIRAARALWNQVAELSGVSEAARAQHQHVVTSRPMMARYDSYTNMLRTTVATLAAGVGGAAAVTVLPFDEPLGLPTPFSRRIARNTSSLLIHESHVAKVIDPAGGSHAIEKLTDDLCMAAWALFGELDGLDELEGVDDLDAAIARLDELVADTREARAAQIAHRTMPITGVSEFPNLGEKLLAREPYPQAPSIYRYAADYEALRDEPAEAPVFLATLGPVASHTARATFVTNLFASGGVSVGVAGATEDTNEVIERWKEAGQPPVVCLAGADSSYTEWGADVIAKLREAGATHVIVAGANKLAADDTAAVGLDALAFLARTREELSR